MKTQKEIKLKDGGILPKGLPVTFNEEKPWICLVQAERPEPYRIRVKSAFKMPSIRSLEEAAMDGVCDSIAGEQVEPDGWDSHGSPSWLLALGMI